MDIFFSIYKYNIIKNYGGNDMRLITAIASILLIIGSLNWGLVGLLKLDIIDKFFGGNDTLIGKILYILIGLAGLYTIFYVIFS